MNGLILLAVPASGNVERGEASFQPTAAEADVPERFRLAPAVFDRSIGAMRQGICDVRRAAAWLAGRPEIDPARLGVTGISLGGIVASVAAAIDPTLNRAVFLLAGGDLARILWEMPEAAKY